MKWQKILRVSLLAIILLFTLVLSQNLLNNPGFEGSYTTRANSWSQNSWGTGNQIIYSRDTLQPHNGSSSQKVQIISLGQTQSGVIFKQDFTFAQDKVYKGSIFLRSDDSIEVQVFFRRTESFYDACVSHTLKIGTMWQAVTLQGGFGGTLSGDKKAGDVPGFLGIQFKSTGTVYVDDASLEAISQRKLYTIDQKIPASLFGMHLNRYGFYKTDTWPDVHFGILRLWDCGTRWNELEEKKGAWNWTRMDSLVKIANNKNQEVLYTMGQTPLWAVAKDTVLSPFYQNAAISEPDTNYWRDYVKTVATRYKGKIKYYEIWNEWNYESFYSGSLESMIKLTRIAYDELKAIDQTIQVISPVITNTGIIKLDEFLNAGGGIYVDIISFHDYQYDNPELSYGFHSGIRNTIENHGIDKPLWRTEGAGGIRTNGDTIPGFIFRSYLTGWLNGISNFNWYAWDISKYGDGNGIPMCLSTDVTEWANGAYEYFETVKWLAGASVHDYTVDSISTWDVKLTLAYNSNAHIVWNPNTKRLFKIPAEWNIYLIKTLSGDSLYPTDTITIGPEPVLLVRGSGAGIKKNTHSYTGTMNFKLFVKNSVLHTTISNPEKKELILQIFNLEGKSLFRKKLGILSDGKYVFPLPEALLRKQIYIFSLSTLDDMDFSTVSRTYHKFKKILMY